MPFPFMVLMVEDDPPTLSLLAAIAKHEGFDVLLAEDGDRALSILERHQVDAMVLDLLLPQTSGLDVIRYCNGKLPRLSEQTVVITAAAEEVYCNCEELRHVRRVFRKPLDIVDLASALHVCRARAASAERGHLSPDATFSARRGV